MAIICYCRLWGTFFWKDAAINFLFERSLLVQFYWSLVISKQKKNHHHHHHHHHHDERSLHTTLSRAHHQRSIGQNRMLSFWTTQSKQPRRNKIKFLRGLSKIWKRERMASSVWLQSDGTGEPAFQRLCASPESFNTLSNLTEYLIHSDSMGHLRVLSSNLVNPNPKIIAVDSAYVIFSWKKTTIDENGVIWLVQSLASSY